MIYIDPEDKTKSNCIKTIIESISNNYPDHTVYWINIETIMNWAVAWRNNSVSKLAVVVVFIVVVAVVIVRRWIY